MLSVWMYDLEPRSPGAGFLAVDKTVCRLLGIGVRTVFFGVLGHDRSCMKDAVAANASFDNRAFALSKQIRRHAFEIHRKCPIAISKLEAVSQVLQVFLQRAFDDHTPHAHELALHGL